MILELFKISFVIKSYCRGVLFHKKGTTLTHEISMEIKHKVNIHFWFKFIYHIKVVETSDEFDKEQTQEQNQGNAKN